MLSGVLAKDQVRKELRNHAANIMFITQIYAFLQSAQRPWLNVFEVFVYFFILNYDQTARDCQTVKETYKA